MKFSPFHDGTFDAWLARRAIEAAPPMTPARFAQEKAYRTERQAYYTARNEHIQRVRWDKGRATRGGHAELERRLERLESQFGRALTRLEGLGAAIATLRARVRADGGGE